MAGVVKADAYGMGAGEVVGQLLQDGCREFFVATAVEGEKLRQVHPDIRIYVLEGAYPENIPTLVAAQLTPVLNSSAQCIQWANTRKPAAIHVDTGMQRLGIPIDQFQAIASELASPIILMISHFANADVPEHDSNATQSERALVCFETVKAKNPQARLSLCNSAGMLNGQGPEDLGRAGIALYGGNPFAELPNPMQAVMSFSARVLQVREVPEGVAIGYGSTFVTREPTRLATVGVGYADGIPRLLSNLGHVAFRGCKLPIVGRVSMDLLTVNASSLGDDTPSEGDWVELVGKTISIDEIASQAQTISYEILTGLGRRTERTYI